MVGDRLTLKFSLIALDSLDKKHDTVYTGVDGSDEIGPFSHQNQHEIVLNAGGLMGTYGLEGVIRAWELEKLTTEQAIGQILQLIVGIEERLQDLEHKHNKRDRSASSAILIPRRQDHRQTEPET